MPRNSSMKIELKAGPNDNGRRLDRILRKALPEYSLSIIHKLLRQKKILVDGKSAGKDFRVQSGSVIVLSQNADLSGTSKCRLPPKTAPVAPPPLPEILWRGAGIIVCNKKSGIATHGPGSLDEIVRAFLDGKLPQSLSFTPGPLHRLDKPVSGVVAFSETIDGARLFSQLLRENKIIKTYLAIVEGWIKNEAQWQDNVIRDTKAKKTFVAESPQARHAVTFIKPVAHNGRHTLAEIKITTGRTHQIRAQAAAHGHPLAGDVKYGGSKLLDKSCKTGFFLHAHEIRFEEKSGDFPRRIAAPLPEAFRKIIQDLGFFEKSFEKR